MSEVCAVCGYYRYPARNCARCGATNSMRDEHRNEIDLLRARVMQLEEALRGMVEYVDDVDAAYDVRRARRLLEMEE
jgi:hypothetical protein